MEDFISKGRIFFRDEVVFGNALARVYNTHRPFVEKSRIQEVDHNRIRNVINQAKDGYISPGEICELLDASGIRRAGEAVADTVEDAVREANVLGFPVVMKVVGPVHKSDVGGVSLNVKDEKAVAREFERMIRIPDTTAVLIQPMLSGIELFVGAKYEPKFGHMILCGLGGIFIEVLKDVAAGLTPLGREEALYMIRNLRSYQIIKGVRGQKGVNENLFVDIILRLSALLKSAPEIMELDFNPLLGNEDSVTVVDARINLKKN
jgi:acetyltransferase